METQEQCRMLSAKALTYQVDVTSEIDVENTFEAVIQDFGQLNGLVNNAGVLRDGLLVKSKDGVISKMSLDQFNLVMNVNVTGTFLSILVFLLAIAILPDVNFWKRIS